MTAEQQAEEAVKALTEYMGDLSRKSYQEGFEQATAEAAAGNHMYTKGFWAGFTIASILFLLGIFIKYIL